MSWPVAFCQKDSNMKDKRIRVGFIGCGWMAGEHLKALGNMKDVHVAAVCDLDETKANRVGAER